MYQAHLSRDSHPEPPTTSNAPLSSFWSSCCWCRSDMASSPSCFRPGNSSSCRSRRQSLGTSHPGSKETRPLDATFRSRRSWLPRLREWFKVNASVGGGGRKKEGTGAAFADYWILPGTIASQICKKSDKIEKQTARAIPMAMTEQPSVVAFRSVS